MKNGTSSNNTGFWPYELQAREGDTVMWINNDTVAHTITSGTANHLNYSGKIFDSGIINPGQEFSFKIPSGMWSAYYYFCKIHPWMTGKVDVGVAYLGKSPSFTIAMDKNSYSTNEIMRISGIVNDTTQTMPLRMQIFNEQREMVFSGSTNLLDNHSFSYETNASNSIFKETGEYKLKAFYGFPATVTDVNFFFNNQSMTGANIAIPHWIKNNARWWSQNQISDQDFIKGMQFLINARDLKIPRSAQTSTNTDVIPSWIKNNAGWWADGTVSDQEFISGIQYLVDHGIIIAQ